MPFVYQDIIANLIANTSIQEEHVFFYDDSIISDEYESVFQFYQSNLHVHYKYGIGPSIFYYNLGHDINAKACTDSGYGLISMNMATILELMNMYRSKEKNIRGHFPVELDLFFDNLDNPVEVLMYDASIHFTFYHEVAHLIQKSKFLELHGLCEHSTVEDEFNILRHVLEIDADEFSAINIATHILQYYENLFGQELESDRLEKLIVITCTSVLLYLLAFIELNRASNTSRFTKGIRYGR